MCFQIWKSKFILLKLFIFFFMSTIIENALSQIKRLCSSSSFGRNVYRLFFFFLSLVEEVDFSFIRNKKIWYLCLWDKVFRFSNSMHSSVYERTKLFRQEYVKYSKPMFKWSFTDLIDVDPSAISVYIPKWFWCVKSKSSYIRNRNKW